MKRTRVLLHLLSLSNSQPSSSYGLFLPCPRYCQTSRILDDFKSLHLAIQSDFMAEVIQFLWDIIYDVPIVKMYRRIEFVKLV